MIRLVLGDEPVSSDVWNDTSGLIQVILRSGDPLSINLTLDVYPLKYVNITVSSSELPRVLV